MISAFGVEHGISKMVARAPKPLPKGKLRKIKVVGTNATHKIVNAGAGPTPVTVALRSITPLRAVLSH